MCFLPPSWEAIFLPAKINEKISGLFRKPDYINFIKPRKSPFPDLGSQKTPSELSRLDNTKHNIMKSKSNIKNKVVIISESGVISDIIKYEVNGKPMSCRNNEKNWRHLYAMSTYSINSFTWELRDWDGSVIDSESFEKSPPFLARRNMFASI